MSISYRAQIQRAILEKISHLPSLHKKDIKTIIDQIKLQYLWNTKITLEELQNHVSYFKSNWHELKEQARQLRRSEQAFAA